MQHNIAVFGGGCFWCTEAVYEGLKGVISVTPGYAGGTTENPSYDEVCSGKTGHAEVIKIEYDPSRISYNDLLTVFFATHDPTTLNRQGNDVGTQYRSIILYTSQEQKELAEAFINDLNDSDNHSSKDSDKDASPKDALPKEASSEENSWKETSPIVTEVKPLEVFYDAEDYHRQYYRKNPLQPYCQVVINPKLQKVKEKFSELLK